MDTRLKKTYAAHRRALQEALPDGLVLIAGGRRVPRNHDVDHRFRQRSDFLWATGIEQPDYALLMDPVHQRSVLFIPHIDQYHRVWMGHVPDRKETRKLYGVEEVCHLDELPGKLAEWRKGLSRHSRCLYTDAAATPLLKGVKHGLRRDSRRYRQALDGLRVLKDKGELALMRRAGEVSSAAHRAAMAAARPGLFEYEVQAILEGEFHRHGLRHCAYESIVAAGVHGAVLHYVHNDQKLRRGDLLLIDAGAECRGYAADITRTFPVSGKFNRRQRDVYEVVLEAQVRCIDIIRPGNTTGDVHRLSQEVLAEGLIDLGFLKGSVEEAIESEALKVFYPHGLGHPLGLDVHDTNGGKRLRVKGRRPKHLRALVRFEPGFVMTVEPGIYFIEALIGDRELRRKHRGRIDFARAEKFLDFGGVRIEDNVVVRAKGPPENLTDVPRTPREVEEACRAD